MKEPELHACYSDSQICAPAHWTERSFAGLTDTVSMPPRTRGGGGEVSLVSYALFTSICAEASCFVHLLPPTHTCKHRLVQAHRLRCRRSCSLQGRAEKVTAAARGIVLHASRKRLDLVGCSGRTQLYVSIDAILTICSNNGFISMITPITKISYN